MDFLHIEPIHERSGKHGWMIHPHSHPDHVQILLVTKGGGETWIEHQPFAIAPPALVVTPGGLVHEIGFLPGTDGYAITIASSYVNFAAHGDTRLIEVTRVPGVYPLAGSGFDPAEIAGLCNMMRNEFVYEVPGRRPAIMAHLITLLVHLIRLKTTSHDAAPPAGDRNHEILTRYRDLLERHFRVEKRLDFYADRLHITVARLNEACKARRDSTASQLLHDRIVTEAKRYLIYSGMTVAEVAHALGYDDPAYFNRFFTKRVGLAPGAFRHASAHPTRSAGDSRRESASGRSR